MEVKTYTTIFDRAKAAYGTGAYDDATLEFLFPQLCESEEETTRKELLDFVRSFWADHKDKLPQARRWVTYLEKQKEQIPYIDFVFEPHEGDDNNPYDMRVPEAHEYAIKRGFDIPFNYGEVYVDERHLTQTIGNILRWADEHPKEQKPAWSEEDEEIFNNIIEKAKGGYWIEVNEITWLITRFKSLRPQLRHRDTYYDIIHNILDSLKGIDFTQITPEHRVSLLNDIRVKCKNADECAAILDEPSWKPSEYHLSALLAVLNDPDNIGSQTCQLALTDLYEQLKKLM